MTSIEEVKKNLLSVLQTSKSGISVQMLERKYEEFLHEKLPFRDLGYNSLNAFLTAINDIAQIKTYVVLLMISLLVFKTVI